MQHAQRELAIGLAERAVKAMDDDWPSATGSVSRRPAPASIVEELSGQGLERLIFDVNPLGQPQGLMPPGEREEPGSDIGVALPPPVPDLILPATSTSSSDEPSKKPSPVSPRTKTGTVAQSPEERRERATRQPAKTAHKAVARHKRAGKALHVAVDKRRVTTRHYRRAGSVPGSIAGVVGAAGQGIGYVGRRIGFALTCLAHVRCRSPRQVAGTVVGAAAGGAVGGTGGGIAGGVIGALATAPRH